MDDLSLYLDCVGSGSPTTVIDAGAGSWSIYYRDVQDELAEITRVCTYDRAGLGLSDEAEGARTSSRMADELHHLLQASGEPGPYLLAGHSLGGYNIRIFQRRYGSDVAGLVLLDAGHPQQWQRLPQIWAAIEAVVPQMRALPDAVAAGQVTLADLSPWPEALAPEMRAYYERAMMEPKVHRASAEEMAGAKVSASQVPEGSLGNLPVVVASAGRSFDAFEGRGLPLEGTNEVWAELQADLLGLSSAAEHRISENGTHDLVVSDRPFTVDAIRRGIELVRSRPEPHLPVPEEWTHRLPESSSRFIDDALYRVEEATRSMDIERFIGEFSKDVEQLDVNRRVRVRGRDAWREQTQFIVSAHRWMERVHHGRLQIAPRRALVEIEWAGSVHGAALGTGSRPDREYRYFGLALVDLDEEGRIERQLLFGDITKLNEDLFGTAVEWTLREGAGGGG